MSGTVTSAATGAAAPTAASAAHAAPRVALLYPGDRAMRERADPAESRFAALFDALAAAGIAAEPAVWHDDVAGDVAAQLQHVQAVLVWCNPIEQGRRRDRLDALLADVAARGVLVSAHPEAVRRLGTKDVLLATRGTPFGSDVHRIDGPAQLAAELPARLARGPRVLKQHRGHSGIGVWRVALADDAGGAGEAQPLLVQHAQRGSVAERMDWPTLQRTLAPCFAPEAGGHLIDQAWQPRIAEGMVRAYLVGDRVCGFGHQAINALHPSEPLPGPRLYHGPDWPPGQALRRQLETSWVELLRDCTGLASSHLPLLWDCDFIPGVAPGAPGIADAADDANWVLCEINVSSVAPFPPTVVAPLVAALQARLASRG